MANVLSIDLQSAGGSWIATVRLAGSVWRRAGVHELAVSLFSELCGGGDFTVERDERQRAGDWMIADRRLEALLRSEGAAAFLSALAQERPTVRHVVRGDRAPVAVTAEPEAGEWMFEVDVSSLDALGELTASLRRWAIEREVAVRPGTFRHFFNGETE